MLNYIIVQAGGKGSRLKEFTTNKPKALVPVNNLPILFHLFRKFPDKRYIIIGDYKKDVLREYLRSFAATQYLFIDGEGSGTCGGIQSALKLIPDGERFMLIWCDLVLNDSFEIPAEDKNYIGISEDFCCRWRYKNGALIEEKSEEYGVAGLFIFKNKEQIADVPLEGEFVRYLSQKNMSFCTLGIGGSSEFGIMDKFLEKPVKKCRPFNKITEKNGLLIKTGIDEQGRKLAIYEHKWYKIVSERGFTAIPHIYNYDPLTMEKVVGKNVYECTHLPYNKKIVILEKIIDNLKNLHNLETVPVDYFSVHNAYIGKTWERLKNIRDLLPFADKNFITVNGRECRNVYFYKREVEKAIENLNTDNFRLLHGDCTFSNILLRTNDDPVFIDPRGYFGYTEMYGDLNYDWAKIYYSIVGNYDTFNLKKFTLSIAENRITLDIQSNGWEDCEKEYFRLTGADERTIKLLHAIIWLSLTTYAWQDFDSLCGAFFNGIYYLEQVL